MICIGCNRMMSARHCNGCDINASRQGDEYWRKLGDKYEIVWDVLTFSIGSIRTSVYLLQEERDIMIGYGIRFIDVKTEEQLERLLPLL